MDNIKYKKLGKKRVISMYEEAELKAKTAIKMADEVKAENKLLTAKTNKLGDEIEELGKEIEVLGNENKELEIKNQELKSENISLKTKADTAKSLGEEALNILDAVGVLKNNTQTEKKQVDAKAKDNVDELLNLQKVKKAICNSKDDSLYKIFEGGVNEAIQTGRDRNRILGAESERLERKIHNCDMIEKYLNLLRDDLDGDIL